ncbi:MAG: alpha/beta hydrolase [Thermoanaerobaculia bacterium]
MIVTLRPLALVLLFASALPLQAQRSRAIRPSGPTYDVEVQRDITYGVVGATALKLDLLRPRGLTGVRVPVVVFVHGGGWSSGDKAGGIGQLTPLVRRGYVGATINYRLSGAAKFPAQIEDAKCAIRYLRANAASLGIDPDRIGVWGSSAGGHLVALLGSTGDVEAWNASGGWPGVSSRVQAVADWYGPSNLNTMGPQSLPCSGINHDAATSPEGQLLGCAIPSCPDRAAAASPVTYVTADDAPTLLMHGTNDCTVPPGQSQELYDALRATGVDATLVFLAGAGHGGPEFAAASGMVIEFFDRQLRK